MLFSEGNVDLVPEGFESARSAFSVPLLLPRKQNSLLNVWWKVTLQPQRKGVWSSVGICPHRCMAPSCLQLQAEIPAGLSEDPSLLRLQEPWDFLMPVWGLPPPCPTRHCSSPLAQPHQAVSCPPSCSAPPCWPCAGQPRTLLSSLCHTKKQAQTLLSPSHQT